MWVRTVFWDCHLEPCWRQLEAQGELREDSRARERLESSGCRLWWLRGYKNGAWAGGRHSGDRHSVSLRYASSGNISARGMFCAGSMMNSFAWTEMKLFVTELGNSLAVAHCTTAPSVTCARASLGVLSSFRQFVENAFTTESVSMGNMSCTWTHPSGVCWGLSKRWHHQLLFTADTTMETPWSPWWCSCV